MYQYNSTSAAYEQLFSQTETSGDTGTTSFVIPDQNETYYLTAVLKCADLEQVGISSLVNPSKFEDGRYPYYGSWGLPASIAGVSSDRIYTAFSIIFITVIAFSAGGGIGTLGLITAGMIGLTKWFGWFREMSWAAVYFFVAMAAAYKLAEGRRRTE